MSVGTMPQLPVYYTMAGFHRVTVAKYHQMIETGVLTEDDAVELLEGHMVMKLPQSPPHSNTSANVEEALNAVLPPSWRLRSQKPITLIDSEPEPDVVLARGDRSTYSSRHPSPSDIGLAIEIADSSLLIDRTDKGRIYARAGLAVYWIINVADRVVEVYTDPRTTDPVPGYGTRTDSRVGDAVPLVLDGQIVALIAVDQLLG